MSNRKIINQLIQLQELIVARMQKKAAMPSAPLEALDENIALLGKTLPAPIKTHLNRLLQKGPEAVVPVVNDNCAACGMALTRSLVNEVIKVDDLKRCPNCTRYLYYPSEVVARERAKRVFGEKTPKGIARFSAPSLMVFPLKGATPKAVLGELCERMSEAGFVEDHAKLLDGALQRETIVSTAVDNGMAFPHVRGVEGGGLAMAVGIHKKGIHFGGPGRRLTRIFFFMVIPTATSAFYLKLISGLSQAFREKETRDELLGVADEAELWKLLVKKTRRTIK